MQDLNDKITGGTLTATEWNEVPSEIQNVIEALGQVLSSGDLNQLGKSIAGYIANANFYTDTGIADAYVLTKIGSKQAATTYTDGFQASFLAGNTNTGASTVNIAGLGIKNVIGSEIAGSIKSGEYREIVYRSSSGDFTLTPFNSRSVSFTPEGTGGVPYDVQTKLREIVSVHGFGAIGDGALTGAAQEGAGTGTDDSAAIQLAFNYIRDIGGTLHFDGSKVYRCDSVLTLLRNSSVGPTNYNIQFNGAALDFSNLASGDYVKVGASSLANIATDVGHINLSKGRIFGQQTGNPGSGTAPTNTATTGLLLEFAYNVVLDHMISTRCYIGCKTTYVFPLTDIQSSFKRNIVGLFLDDVSNDSTWIRTEAAQCRFAMVAQPSGVYDSGKMTNNRFDGFRGEGCQVGVHLDPGSNRGGFWTIRDFNFDTAYFAGPTYDIMRIGTEVDLTDASIRGADSDDRVYNMRVKGGFWSMTPSATQAAIAFSNNSNVRQGVFEVPVNPDDEFTIVNSPRLCEILLTAQPDTVSDTFQRTQYGAQGQKWTEPQKALQTMANVDATPDVFGHDNFETNTGTITIKDFDNGEQGQRISVLSKGAISYDFGQTASGTHDGSSGASTLTDTGASFNVNGLEGLVITNTTDGSSGTITANTATTITATLSGGTDNDWDASDAYTIESSFKGSSSSIVTASGDITEWKSYDGFRWQLLGYIDSSADNSSGA